jgi:hypothetical protein
LAPFDKIHQKRTLYPHRFRQGNFPVTTNSQWVDEDEQDGDASDPMSSYNLGAGGMPDMGDLDFSKLGGGAGMGGLGGMDMGAAGMGGDDDDESDDDMPELETDDAQDVGKGKEPATS